MLKILCMFVLYFPLCLFLVSETEKWICGDQSLQTDYLSLVRNLRRVSVQAIHASIHTTRTSISPCPIVSAQIITEREVRL